VVVVPVVVVPVVVVPVAVAQAAVAQAAVVRAVGQEGARAAVEVAAARTPVLVLA